MVPATILLALLSFARAAPSPVQLDERALSHLYQREAGTRVAPNVAISLPTDLSSGILPGFEDIPSQDKIKEKLGLNDDQIAQLPLQFMNIAGYANFTNSGWNLRIHGLAYKTPNATPAQLDDISSTFISGYDVKNLNATQLQQSRNMSAALITLLAGQNQQIKFNLLDQGQLVMGPYAIQTDDRGEIDQFVPVSGVNFPSDGRRAKKLDLYTQGIDLGNASSYLVPPNGYSLVADIDDILRFTQIYQPTNGLDNSFANPFVPWTNMPDIMNGWASSDPDLHFHYLTTTPEQFTRVYEDFIYDNFPAGSFDIRPLNFTTVDQIFAVRNVSLVKFFETFPTRKIILMADTSNSDVMKDYPQMAHSFPNQVACILLRNTSATDDDMFPYDTSGFKGLDQSKYMFFRTTDDIRNLKFSNGDCYNSSVPQNVTFKTQGGPFSAASVVPIPRGGLAVAIIGAFLGALLVV